MAQIVVTFDEACGVDERKAALWCAALDAQAAEFCGKHGLDPVPVNYYSTDVLAKLEGDELAAFASDSYMVTVQISLDVANALGFHDDVAGTIFARVEWQGDATTITLSHEILELLHCSRLPSRCKSSARCSRSARWASCSGVSTGAMRSLGVSSPLFIAGKE